MAELSQRSQAESLLSIRAEYTPFVNFAMQQNAVPLLRALAVTNFSAKQATHLVVRVWSDPPVVAEKMLRVDAIAPGASYTFSDLALTLLRGPQHHQRFLTAVGILLVRRARQSLPEKTRSTCPADISPRGSVPLSRRLYRGQYLDLTWPALNR